MTDGGLGRLGRLAAVVAAAVVVVAAAGALLVRPVSGAGRAYSARDPQVTDRVAIPCGSVRSPTTDFDEWAFRNDSPSTVPAATLAEQECARALDDRRSFAAAVAAVGALVLVVGLASELARARRARRRARGDGRATDRRTVWPIVLGGALGVIVALGAGFGFLAIGIAEVAIVLLVAHRRPRSRDTRSALGSMLVVLMLGGMGFVLIVDATELLPDPFGTNPVAAGSDLYCGSASKPGTDDHLGCAQWREDRAIEAAWFGALALTAVAAMTADWAIERRRTRISRGTNPG